MITFEKFYNAHIVNESTRRSFLKKAMGAIAGTFAGPGNVASPVAAAAKLGRPGFPLYTYDVTDATSLPNIKLMLAMLHDQNPLSSKQMDLKANKIYEQFKSGRFNTSTLKKLIAVSEETRNLFITHYTGAGLDVLKSKMPDITNKQLYSEDVFLELRLYADRMFSNLETKLFTDNDEEIFNYLPPFEIYFKDNLLMNRDEAQLKHIFKSLEEVEKNLLNNAELRQAVERIAKKAQKKAAQDDKANKKADSIEYSPADYKGGWEHDPDYQSLSMGESIVAEKNIHDPVRPGILKRQVKGKMTCSKARSLKSKQKNKGNNTAKAAQRYLNYHC